MQARRPIRHSVRRLLLVAMALTAATTVRAAESDPGRKRHHIGVQLGVFNPSADTLEIARAEVRASGYSGLGILSYRYSATSHVDVDLELRHWIDRFATPTHGKVKLAVGFIGPGIRVNAFHQNESRRVQPYVQANLYYVQEQQSLTELRIVDGVGFGLSGGLDLELGSWLSVPFEVTYVRSGGDDLNDLSGLGFSIGINFNL